MSETDKLEQSEKMKKRAGELVKVRFHIKLKNHYRNSLSSLYLNKWDIGISPMKTFANTPCGKDGTGLN
jgi:hypothetical protein